VVALGREAAVALAVEPGVVPGVEVELGVVVAAGEAAVVEDGLVPVRTPPGPDEFDGEPDGVEPDEVEAAGAAVVWLGVPDGVRVVSAMQSSAHSNRAKPAESVAS